MDEERIRKILAEQDGVITLKQATAAGMSRSGVWRRVSRGIWEARATGVFRATDRLLTPRTRMRIAVAAAGPDAALCCRSAAFWHGLTGDFPPVVEVHSPTKGRHRAAVAGSLVHFHKIDDEDLTVVDGVRVTRIPLCLLRSAATLGSTPIDNALLRNRVTLDELDAALARYSRRPGNPELRQLLRALRPGARSEAERVTVTLFDVHDITGWVANTTICGHLADFVFEEPKLIVEIDGFAFHRDAATFQRDRTKRNALIAAGWTVLNFTWDDITRRPDEVIAAINDALRRVDESTRLAAQKSTA